MKQVRSEIEEFIIDGMEKNETQAENFHTSAIIK